MNQLKITELIQVKEGKVITVNSNGSKNYISKQFSGQRKIKPVDSFSRLFQSLVDILLISLILYVFTLVGIELDFWISVLVFLSYYLSFEISLNTTPGKILFKHVIVDEYGNPLSKSKLIIRNLSRIIPFDPFSIFGKRSIHDICSNCYLLHTDELKELIVLREKNIKEINQGNSRYELSKLNNKLAYIRKEELIKDLKIQSKESRFTDFLTFNSQISHAYKPKEILTFKKFLPTQVLLFTPPLISIFLMFPILGITKLFMIYINFYPVLFLLWGIIAVILTVFIRPTLEIDKEGIREYTFKRSSYKFKFIDCVYIYFKIINIGDSRLEGLGFLLKNNTEPELPINIGSDKEEIGKTIYYWMKNKNES